MNSTYFVIHLIIKNIHSKILAMEKLQKLSISRNDQIEFLKQTPLDVYFQIKKYVIIKEGLATLVKTNFNIFFKFKH